MWLPITIAAVVVLAIAWFAVAMVTAKLDATPSRAVFDIEEATTFVSENLPDRVRNQLSYDDVRVLLRWQLTYLRERGVASFGGVDHVAEAAARVATPMVADEDELVDELLARADAEGLDADAVDVVCVADLTTQYLLKIGAIGVEIDTAGALPAPTTAEALGTGRQGIDSDIDSAIDDDIDDAMDDAMDDDGRDGSDPPG